MPEPKPKVLKREAGARKYRLPEREPRPIADNPLRELLAEAREQEKASRHTAEQTVLRAVEHVAPSAPTPVPAATIETAQPQTTRSEIRGVNTRLLAAIPFPPLPELDAEGQNLFREFTKRWQPVLRRGQLKMLEAIFKLCYDANSTECFTSISRLSKATDIKRRQCFNIIAQLEQSGIIQRSEFFNTAMRRETKYRLLVPVETAPQSQPVTHHHADAD